MSPERTWPIILSTLVEGDDLSISLTAIRDLFLRPHGWNKTPHLGNGR